MTFQEGALFGILGCLLYQMVSVYQYRAEKLVWPWNDKRNRLTKGFFIYGAITKIVIAGSLAALMTHTGQTSGPWAAFLVGMVAERIILVLGDKTLKELTK